jgi:ribosome-associated toxin RatA of RatAB toxin-antitoxin module
MAQNKDDGTLQRETTSLSRTARSVLSLKRWHRAAVLAAGIGLAVLPVVASAEPTAEAKRLIQKRDAERYQVKTPYSSVKAGAARIAVAAPLNVVRSAVMDFSKWDDRIKRFDKSSVVGKKKDHTDVYVQVPILKGLAKVWAVVRFEPLKKLDDGQEVLVGRMIKGNVKRLDATWRLTKIDDENTQLNLELLIVPDMPVPGSVITGEVAYAADEAVMGMRDHSEKAARHQ